ncbi:hypothetical protein B1R94_17530 [Mycolicibacterium litorale]|nr:hypothetical protein B1R94_17530 [Mycolicibacterium litorale]
MRPPLELTSVPAWAVEPTSAPADLSGRQWTVLAIGPDAAAVADRWVAEIAGRHPGARPWVHLVDDAEAACTALDDDLTRAVVGWRLLITGSAHDCLRVRARALELGAADDEITVASTDVDTRTVFCAHCRAVTTAVVGLSETVPCTGCGRELFVYYHVSRRLGTHLGFATAASYRGTT